jgi:MSHA biogenesis protein MshJ
MKLPAPLEKAFARFNGLSLRERALLAAGILAALVMAWDAALMRPVNAREAAATAELQKFRENANALESSLAPEGADATSQAQEQERALRSALDAAEVQLTSASAGLIPPERMVDVIHDVLNRRPGVRLVSLRNQPVVSLIAQAQAADAEAIASSSGPYVHPLELTIEGEYLDLLAYLQALEGSPWRFYWKVLEIETIDYPLNRARIELRTLSMDKEWLGV